MVAMAATPAVLSVRRGRSRSRKILPNALSGAGSATHVPGGAGMSGQELVFAEVYTWLIGSWVCQMVLVQVVSHLAAMYLLLASLQVSAFCSQANSGGEETAGSTAQAQERAPQALPGSTRPTLCEGPVEQASQALPGAPLVGKTRRHLVKTGLLLVVTLVLAVAGALHKKHQQQARVRFESGELDVNESGALEWGVVFRAGGPWHGEPDNVTSRGQAVLAGRSKFCFFLQFDGFREALGGVQHLVIRVGKRSSSWRKDVMDRVLEVDERLAAKSA